MNKSLLILCILLLASCAEELTADKEENLSKQIQSTVGVELGFVKGASVVIQALDGYTLYNSITNNKGYFTYHVEELKSAVNNYGEDLKFVKIVATGGIDIDPNDDGVIIESEQIAVKGSVTGVVPLKTLYEGKNFRINFISTALVDMLEDQKNISNVKLSYLIKRLKVPDINNDDKVDVDDLIGYKVNAHDSVAEVNLREGFLEYIHNGDENSKKLFVENFKYDVGLTQPTITKKDGYYEVSLSKTNENNKIYYGIAVDQNRPSYQQYSSELLHLNYNTALFYQECSDNYGCYKLQKIFFYANQYYLDYDYEPIEDNYSEVQEKITELNGIREKQKQTKQEIKKLKEELNSLKKIGELWR